MEGRPLRALCCLVALLAAGSLFARPKPVEVILPARVAFEPVDLHFRVRVEPSPANRAFSVVAWCGEDALYTTARQLDGSERPSHWLVWKGMPACEYQIRATVYSADGTTAATSESFSVQCAHTCAE